MTNITPSEAHQHLDVLLKENEILRSLLDSRKGVWENLLLRIARYQLDHGPVRYDQTAPDPLWDRVLAQLDAGNLSLGFGGGEVSVSIRNPVEFEGRAVPGLVTLTKENLP